MIEQQADPATDKLPFTCECGAITGHLQVNDEDRGDRYVCHCNDCQAFAHFLERPEQMLDAHAGTHVYQIGSFQFQLEQGQDSLACISVTGGPLLRWYCRSCRTPVANTLSHNNWPFLSLILSGFDQGAVDRALGPEVAHVSIESGAGDPGDVKKAGMAKMLLKLLGRRLRAMVDRRRRRSALFDPVSGEPVMSPETLGGEQRAEIDARAAAHREKLIANV